MIQETLSVCCGCCAAIGFGGRYVWNDEVNELFVCISVIVLYSDLSLLPPVSVLVCTLRSSYPYTLNDQPSDFLATQWLHRYRLCSMLVGSRM